MTRLTQFTAASLLLAALSACTPSSPTTSTTAPPTSASTASSTSASTASITPTLTPTPTPTPTPAQPAVLTLNGYGEHRFGMPWHADENVTFVEVDESGPGACSHWQVLGTAGEPIGFAPSRKGSDAPVRAFQTLSPELQTGYGIHVGSSRDEVLAVTDKLIVANPVQEAYYVTDGTSDLVIDLEPTTGEVVVLTVVPTSDHRQSFYRTETICD